MVLSGRRHLRAKPPAKDVAGLARFSFQALELRLPDGLLRNVANFFAEYLCVPGLFEYHEEHRGACAPTPRLPQVPAPPVGAFLLRREGDFRDAVTL
jgi:hypothetical protein